MINYTHTDKILSIQSNLVQLVTLVYSIYTWLELSLSPIFYIYQKCAHLVSQNL